VTVRELRAFIESPAGALVYLPAIICDLWLLFR